MKALMELKEMLFRELEEEARKGELSAGSLETVHKITDTIKNIDKIMMLEGDEGGYSGDGDWMARGTYSRGGYSRDSYCSGRRSSYGNGYSSGRRGGYMRGYSRAESQDMMVDRINDMMQQGGMSAEERNVLQHAMQILGER